MKQIELRYQSIAFSKKIQVNLEQIGDYEAFAAEVVLNGYPEFKKELHDLYVRIDGESVDLENKFDEFKEMMQDLEKIKIYIVEREYTEDESESEKQESSEEKEDDKVFY